MRTEEGWYADPEAAPRNEDDVVEASSWLDGRPVLKGVLAATAVVGVLTAGIVLLSNATDDGHSTGVPQVSPSVRQANLSASEKQAQVDTLLSRVLGPSNRGIKDRVAASVAAGPRPAIAIRWALNDGLFRRITGTDLRSEITEILAAVHREITWDYSSVVLGATYAVPHESGKARETEVFVGTYQADVVNHIDFGKPIVPGIDELGEISRVDRMFR